MPGCYTAHYQSKNPMTSPLTQSESPRRHDMPLSLRSFLLCFVALCVAFVPVFIFVNFWTFILPISALALTVSWSRLEWSLLLSIGIYVSVYIGLFTGVGALAYVLIRRVPRRSVRIILLSILLSLPVLSSFARVITYGGLRWGGGTYTFWEAVHRYFEKRR